ncbi:MAG: sugar ABC transporter ATP-binding protein [Acidimicrobiia bacterium]
MTEPLLAVEGIDKAYPGVQALAGVDLEVGVGEVHAVLGENGAGKSTLMKVVAGSVVPDAGRMALGGEPVSFGSPQTARRRGIGIVYQELSLVPSLSVAENVLLGRWPQGRWGAVDWPGLRRQSSRHLARVGLAEDPARPVAELGMAERQLVEIAKALSTDARVLLLDEPTSALSDPEAQRLFAMIRDLQGSGVAIVYVSHRLAEVLEIAHRVTVLRDGRKVATLPVGEVTESTLAQMMVGREVGISQGPDRPAAANGQGRVVLRARGLHSPPGLRPVDLELRAGKVVGVFGLVGSGRSVLGRAIFGLEPVAGGELEVFDRRVRIGSPADAIKLGLGYVAPDRSQAMVPRLTVAANITLASLHRLGSGPTIDFSREREIAGRLIKQLDIRVRSSQQPGESLSGGNQQKVMVARCLASESRILLLDDPTRGIDVGAKEEVFRLVGRLAADGVAILYSTSEIKELAMTDRVLVMAAGRIVAEVASGTPQDQLMELAGGTRG